MTLAKNLPLAALIALVIGVLTFQLALGHSRPVRFEPAPGAVLETSPAQVTGWFTGELRRDPNWTHLRVAASDGRRVDTGETQLSTNRKQLTVGVEAGLAPGRYVVQWSAWDDDDHHILSDCFTFFIGQPAAEAAVQEGARLDGGAACVRLDVSAELGTPVPGATPEPPHVENGTTPEEAEGNGVPVWLLIISTAAALAVGLVGGRLIGARP